MSRLGLRDESVLGNIWCLFSQGQVLPHSSKALPCGSSKNGVEQSLWTAAAQRKHLTWWDSSTAPGPREPLRRLLSCAHFPAGSAHIFCCQSTRGGEWNWEGEMWPRGLSRSRGCRPRAGSHLDKEPELWKMMILIDDQGSEGQAGTLAPGLPNQDGVSFLLSYFFLSKLEQFLRRLALESAKVLPMIA